MDKTILDEVTSEYSNKLSAFSQARTKMLELCETLEKEIENSRQQLLYVEELLKADSDDFEEKPKNQQKKQEAKKVVDEGKKKQEKHQVETHSKDPDLFMDVSEDDENTLAPFDDVENIEL